MVSGGSREEVRLQFVWSDDLARMLIEEGEATAAELLSWTTAIVGYRLPEGVTPFQFALELWDDHQAPAGERRAS